MPRRDFSLPILFFVVGGCLPMRVPAPPELRHEVDEAEKVAAVIETHGAWPLAEQMTEDIRLVTPEVERVDAAVRRTVGRDTVRGRPGVVAYLQLWQSMRAHDGLFELETRDVLVCEGRALQRGRYTVPADPGSGVPQRFASFFAVWDQGGGPVLLNTLELDTDGDRDRDRSRAADCVSIEDLRAELRRSTHPAGFIVSLSLSSRKEAGDVEAAFREAGWTWDCMVRYESGPCPDFEPTGSQLFPALDVFYQLTPRWSMLLVVDPQSPISTFGSANFGTNLAYWGATVGGLAVGSAGAFEVGVGPAFAWRHWEWTAGLPEETVTRSTVVPGGIMHVGAMQPLNSTLFIRAAAEYHVFRDAEMAGYGDIEVMRTNPGGIRATVGIGYAW